MFVAIDTFFVFIPLVILTHIICTNVHLRKWFWTTQNPSKEVAAELFSASIWRPNGFASRRDIVPKGKHSRREQYPFRGSGGAGKTTQHYRAISGKTRPFASGEAAACPSSFGVRWRRR